MGATSTVFSEYELRRMSIKINQEDAEYESADCVGSCEEEMETKVITKNCRGVVAKRRVKGTGNGTLNISAHVPIKIFRGIFGMYAEGLLEGVYAYGQNSVHPEFSVVTDVFDEDGNEKFKAYPNCIMQSGVARKIENGAEEVAELELEISVTPDEEGNGLYEALASELKDENVKSTWMTVFTPELVKKTTPTA